MSQCWEGGGGRGGGHENMQFMSSDRWMWQIQIRHTISKDTWSRHLYIYLQDLHGFIWVSWKLFTFSALKKTDRKKNWPVTFPLIADNPYKLLSNYIYNSSKLRLVILSSGIIRWLWVHGSQYVRQIYLRRGCVGQPKYWETGTSATECSSARSY